MNKHLVRHMSPAEATGYMFIDAEFGPIDWYIVDSFVKKEELIKELFFFARLYALGNQKCRAHAFELCQMVGMVERVMT